MNRTYKFGDTKVKVRSENSQYVRELKSLLNKQRRWMTRIKRAMTAIAKIERQIKRLDQPVKVK